MSELVGTSAGALLHLVRTGRASTRGELAELTGLSRTAVTVRVSRLQDAGLLVEGAPAGSTGGRRAASLAVDPDAAVVVGVAVGRSRSQLGVFDLAGRELVGDTVDHEVGAGPDVVLPSLAERMERLLGQVDHAVAAVGMSMPGTVDPRTATSLDAPVMRGWDRVPLAPYLSRGGTLPLLLCNDTTALVHSELFGGSPESPDLLVVKASTGLGLGMVADGRLVHAASGVTGELGHTKVDAAGDVPCRCGATGCLEAIAGGWALVQQLADAGTPVADVRGLVTLALDGDPLARRLLRDSGRQLGEVLAVAVNLLHPGVVVVGGDMGAAFDLYAAGIRESVYARGHAGATRDLRFTPARHGESAGLVGCAAAAIDHVLAPAEVDRRLA